MNPIGPKFRMMIIIVCAAVLTAAGFLTADNAAAQENLTYRLKWLYNVSVIGDLYARDAGFFEAVGLRVEVKAGGPERDAIRELELGYADFGVASADQVIRARSKGAPVVVLAQLFQINPLQWIYRADEHTFAHIADFRGKTIGITYGGNDETIMRTILAKAGIQESDVHLFSVRYDFTPFFQRRADIWPVYRNAQGPILADKLNAAGESVGFFNPADHGVRFVANSVVTSRRVLDQRPLIAAKFVRALLKGWESALDPANAQKALKTLQQYDKDTSFPLMERQLEITRRLIKPAPDVPVGRIDAAAWKQTEEIMLKQQLIPAPVAIADAIFPPGSDD